MFHKYQPQLGMAREMFRGAISSLYNNQSEDLETADFEQQSDCIEIR